MAFFLFIVIVICELLLLGISIFAFVKGEWSGGLFCVLIFLFLIKPIVIMTNILFQLGIDPIYFASPFG